MPIAAGRGRRIAFAVLALGVAAFAAAGMTGRISFLQGAEEWYASFRFGKLIFVDIYDVSTFLSSTDDPFSSSGPPRPVDAEFLAMVKRQMMDCKADPWRPEPEFFGGSMMVKATARDHLRVRRLLDSLGESR